MLDEFKKPIIVFTVVLQIKDPTPGKRTTLYIKLMRGFLGNFPLIKNEKLIKTIYLGQLVHSQEYRIIFKGLLPCLNLILIS